MIWPLARSIRAQAFVAPVVVMLSLMVMVFQGEHVLDATIRRIEAFSTQELPKRAEIEKLSSELTDAQLLLFRYVSWLNSGVAADQLAALQQTAKSQIGILDAHAAKLQSRANLSPDERAILAEVGPAVGKLVEGMRSTMDIGDVQPSMATMMLGDADEQMRKVRARLDDLQALGARSVDELIAQILGGAHADQRNSLIIALAALVVGLSLTYVMTMSIVRPLQRITQVVRELLNGRDRDIDEASRSRKDEIGELASSLSIFQQALRENARLGEQARQAALAAERQREESERARNAAIDSERQAVTASVGHALSLVAAMDLRARIEAVPREYDKLRSDFNDAVEQLEEVLLRVNSSALEISSETKALTLASENLTRRTEQQAGSLNETVAAVSTVTEKMQSAAQGAKSAHATALQTRDEARRVEAVTQTAVDSMVEIERASQHIEAIVGVIDEVAFQTNLLALNAGVEAARAGEAGGGFAVVASEVRQLAQRSAASAKEIKTLIADVNNRIHLGGVQVREVGEIVRNMGALVQRAESSVAQILGSTADQAAALTGIQSAVRDLDQVTRQNAAMVDQSIATTQNLDTTARTLLGIVSQFRLADSRGVAATARPRPSPGRAAA